ncbi:MAG: amidohydrolase family protein [Cyanobacteria bacterium SZAS-4]|nr:amidohydrolase family protein [Cyanobacteria bacterium SZAS-4]
MPKRLLNSTLVAVLSAAAFASWCAAPVFAQNAPCALHGTVVNADGEVKDEWVSFVDGRITAITETKPVGPKIFIEVDGFVYPGLIDTHNHVHYNVIPQWSNGQYPNRYAWQQDPEYLEKVENQFVRESDSGETADAVLYGEARSVIGGATLIQSNYAKPQAEQFIRNLDVPNYRAESYTGPIEKIDPAVADKLRDNLNGTTLRLFFHIAEGKKSDTATQVEFGLLKDKGFARSGVVLIHGIALTPANFAEMKQNKMHLVWSPRSNLRLYGETTDVQAALDAGLKVAIAPDWTVTGSSNMLDELRFARNYLNRNRKPQEKFPSQKLFEMATSNAAEVAGVSDKLGSIEVKKCADFLITKKLVHYDKKTDAFLKLDAYDSLVQCTPGDVELVVVAGRPVYGDSELMSKYAKESSAIKVANSNKRIAIHDEKTDDHFVDFNAVEARIKKALPCVAPLYEP